MTVQQMYEVKDHGAIRIHGVITPWSIERVCSFAKRVESIVVPEKNKLDSHGGTWDESAECSLLISF